MRISKLTLRGRQNLRIIQIQNPGLIEEVQSKEELLNGLRAVLPQAFRHNRDSPVQENHANGRFKLNAQ